MSRDLADLLPEFREMAEPFILDWRAQANGYDLIVTCTYRTFEEQTALFAQGRTAPGAIVTRARAGESAHNYRLAIDVVPVVHSKAIWDTTDPIWQEIGNFGRSHGLRWYGAPDAPFKEDPHFEHPDWKRLAGVAS